MSYLEGFESSSGVFNVTATNPCLLHGLVQRFGETQVKPNNGRMSVLKNKGMFLLHVFIC